VALLGYYTAAFAFDSQPALSAPTGADVYLATLADANGAASSSVAMGGAGTDYSTSIAASGHNIVVTGRFSVTATFLGLPLTATHAMDNFVLSLFR
jgi:hypothetical protein